MKLKLQKSPLENSITTLSNMLNLLEIKTSKESESRIKECPSYPSALCLAAALRHFNVRTLTVRIPFSKVIEAPLPAIAHSRMNGGTFLILTEYSEETVTYHNPESGWIIEGAGNFKEHFSGNIILIKANSYSEDPDYNVNKEKSRIKLIRAILFMALASVIAYITPFRAMPVIDAFTGLILFIGCLINSLIIAVELDNATAVNICGSFKKANCKEFLKSESQKLLGLAKISDIGLTWFLGSGLFWVLTNLHKAYNISVIGVAVASMLCAPGIFFSLYYQGVKLKKWCAMCLGVQAILLTLIILTASYLHMLNEFIYQPYYVCAFIISYFFSFLLVITVRPLLESYTDNENLRQLNEFRNNSELFNNITSSVKSRIDTEFLHDITAGNNEAKSRLLVITNPNCRPCSNAHHVLEKILAMSEDRISINFRFLVSDKLSHEIASSILALPQPIQHQALKDWFAMHNYKDWTEKYKSIAGELKEANEKLASHIAWCNQQSISETPTFIYNDQRIPSCYRGDDLVFHLLNQF